MDKEVILRWLSGYGDGYGYGDGSGYGYGSGDGDGSGYGDGDGSGDGSGYGERIKKYKGEDVYYIDCIPTVIHSIKGNYAKGFTINDDFGKTPCFVARSADGRLFAHGNNLHEAVAALEDKVSESMTEEERIELFCKSFKKTKKYKGTVFFDWHNRLTGSCLFGRNQFVKDKGLDVQAEYTVDEFIAIVENAYGSVIIKKLKSVWESV